MKYALLALGVLAWAGVAGVAVLMADVDEPVLGFFPIAGAVIAAWVIGEYVTEVIWKGDRRA